MHCPPDTWQIRCDMESPEDAAEAEWVRCAPICSLSTALGVEKQPGRALQMCKLQMCTHLVPPDVHKRKPPGSAGVLEHPCAFSCVPSCDLRGSPAVGLKAAAFPTPHNPPRCEHLGGPWCPRCVWKSLPPPQLYPKCPPDVNALGDLDVQIHVGTLPLLLCMQM